MNGSGEPRLLARLLAGLLALMLSVAVSQATLDRPAAELALTDISRRTAAAVFAIPEPAGEGR
jgi:hypothetical protein